MFASKKNPDIFPQFLAFFLDQDPIMKIPMFPHVSTCFHMFPVFYVAQPPPSQLNFSALQGTRHLRTNTSPVVAADRRASQIHRRGQYRLGSGYGLTCTKMGDIPK